MPRLQPCVATNAEIQAAMARLAPFPEGQRMVDTLMQENPHLTWGDAIVQADGLMIGKTVKLLEEFKATGANFDEELESEFSIFKGYAPPDHPYPAAWTKGRCESFQKEGGKTLRGCTEIVICGKCDCDVSRHKGQFFQGQGHKLSGGASSSKLDEMD